MTQEKTMIFQLHVRNIHQKIVEYLISASLQEHYVATIRPNAHFIQKQFDIKPCAKKLKEHRWKNKS